MLVDLMFLIPFIFIAIITVGLGILTIFVQTIIYYFKEIIKDVKLIR
jgi:hypothetical protein